MAPLGHELSLGNTTLHFIGKSIPHGRYCGQDSPSSQFGLVVDVSLAKARLYIRLTLDVIRVNPPEDQSLAMSWNRGK